MCTHSDAVVLSQSPASTPSPPQRALQALARSALLLASFLPLPPSLLPGSGCVSSGPSCWTRRDAIPPHVAVLGVPGDLVAARLAPRRPEICTPVSLSLSGFLESPYQQWQLPAQCFQVLSSAALCNASHHRTCAAIRPLVVLIVCLPHLDVNTMRAGVCVFCSVLGACFQESLVFRRHSISK